MSHSPSGQLMQFKSEPNLQEAEQNEGSEDAQAGMGTWCCSCLLLDQGSDLADHETGTAAELELPRLVRERSQTLPRYAALTPYHSRD